MRAKQGNREVFVAEDSTNQVTYSAATEGSKILLSISDTAKDSNSSVAKSAKDKDLSLAYERNLKRGNPAPDSFTLKCE